MRPDEERRYTDYVSARLPWIRKVAFLVCQDWHRADDIAQTAITRLYAHWRSVAVAKNLDAYVRAVVVRVFLSLDPPINIGRGGSSEVIVYCDMTPPR